MTTVLRRWRPLAAVAAAILAFVLVPQGTRAGAVPLTPGVIDPGDGVISRWVLTAADQDPINFLQCSGMGSRSSIQTGNYNGTPTRLPANVQWADITCTQAVPGSKPLYIWRQNIEENDLQQGIRDVHLLAFDASGHELQDWSLTDTWPSQYIQAFDRVVVVLTHNGAGMTQP
jgi:hypothetical protein